MPLVLSPQSHINTALAKQPLCLASTWVSDRACAKFPTGWLNFFPGHYLVTCLSCLCKKYSKTSGGALYLSGKQAAVYGTVTQHRTCEGTHLGPLLVAEQAHPSPLSLREDVGANYKLIEQ